MFHPAINADIGVTHITRTALHKLELGNHIATKFLVSLVTAKRKARTAKIVLGSRDSAVHGTVAIESCRTAMAVFVPELVTDIADFTSLVRRNFHRLAGMFSIGTEILSKSSGHHSKCQGQAKFSHIRNMFHINGLLTL